MASSRRTPCNWCECDTKSCCDCWVSERHTLLTELYFLLLATLAPAVLVWPVTLLWFSPVSRSPVSQRSPVNIYYAARILWILNTYRPRIHTCGSLTAYQHIQQTPNSGQQRFSLNTIPESRQGGCCILLSSEQSPQLHWVLKWASPPFFMTWPTRKNPPWSGWKNEPAFNINIYYDHHFSQSGRSVNPFQPSWEC